jgi:hypothetical protein
MSVINRMKKILETPAFEEEGVGNAAETNILQHIALAAAAMGVDVSDNDAVDQFIADVRQAVTKEKAQLKSQLRRFTNSKAKAAAKGTVKSLA